MTTLNRLFKLFGASPAQPPTAPADPLEEERTVRAAAEAAVARLDLPTALAALLAWEHRANEPETLALLGHVLKTMGEPERAQAVLTAALRAHRDHPVVLETLAQLHEFLRDAKAEFQCRKQRMMQPDCRVGHVLDAMRALVQIKGPDGAPPAADLRLVRAMFQQRAAFARPEECIRFAEMLYRVDSAQDEASRMLARYLPASAGTHDVTFRRATAQQVPPGGGELLACGSGVQAAQMLVLKDAWVMSGLHWSPCLPGAGLVFDAFMTMQPALAIDRATSPLLARSGQHMRLRLDDAPPVVVKGPCVLLGGDGSSNYYHFLHEHLSRLEVLHALGVDPAGMRYVIGGGLLAFHHEFLALLGIGADQLVTLPAQGALAFEQLLAPLPLGRGGAFTSPLIARWARERVLPAAGAGPAGASRKLFLSRARTGRRRIVNEDLVYEVFAGHGYELVYSEELGVREQVALFAQATHIAGSGGAALTNMLFMPPGGHVLMLNNRYIPAHARTLFFGPLAAACGHAFTILSGEPVAFPTDRAIDADVRIDVDAVRALLQTA